MHLAYLQNYKQDFKEYIIKHKKESALTNIEITASDLYDNTATVSWEDDNREIVYQGKLYDIIALKPHGNKVTITVASDDQEMALKKEFASMYDVNSHSSTKGPFELLKNFLMLKYLVNTSEINFNNTTPLCISKTTSPVFSITPVVINPDTPPPDFFI